MFLFDRYIPISHFLDHHLKDKNKKVNTLIIPPICDFYFFKTIDSSNQFHQPYFLYCGSAAYYEVVEFIIDSFKKIKNNDTTHLHLVLNGIKSEELKNLLKENNDKVKVFSNLDYNDLIRLYKNAFALLIPLRNTKQDEGRFPQKICEYLASEKTVISTNFGEVKFYFKDMVNALIAKDYDVASYSEKMQWALSNVQYLKIIEEEAYKTGKDFFDITSYKETIKHFTK
ncbi:MAG: glycosyltransferase [Flavobacterium sp.]